MERATSHTLVASRNMWHGIVRDNSTEISDMYFTMIPTWGRFHSTLRFQSDASLLLLRVAGFASLTPETGFSPGPPARRAQATSAAAAPRHWSSRTAVRSFCVSGRAQGVSDNGRKEADATDAESEAGYIGYMLPLPAPSPSPCLYRCSSDNDPEPRETIACGPLTARHPSPLPPAVASKEVSGMSREIDFIVIGS